MMSDKSFNFLLASKVSEQERRVRESQVEIQPSAIHSCVSRRNESRSQERRKIAACRLADE